MLLCPLNGHLLIRPVEEKIKTANNITMEKVKDKRMLVKGHVLAEDPALKEQYPFVSTDPILCFKGTTVHYPLYAAVLTLVEGEVMHLVNAKDLVLFE